MKIPAAAGVTVIVRDIKILVYGMTRVSSVQLRLYNQMLRGIIPSANTVDTVVIVRLLIYKGVSS